MSAVPKLAVSVQLASGGRQGVPHAHSFDAWAQAAARSPGRRPLARGPLELTIRIVGAEESRVLNHQWRGRNKPTNVLSFPGEFQVLGDLAICEPVVAREASEQGKVPRAHWAHMVVHGVLHLLGYDHENDSDATAMEAREVKILEQFGYANPYD